jgi:hypothetical protein
MKKIITILSLILVIGGFVCYLYSRDKVQAAVQITQTAIIGTRSGTTTTPVNFYGKSGYTATTSYYATSSGAQIATFSFKVVEASSSAALSLSFFGSNDNECATLRTTAATNTVVQKDINWYDIGSHIAELAGTQTLSSATSTIAGPVANGQGKDITFTNLNYQCLKVDASGSSTRVYLEGKFTSQY